MSKHYFVNQISKKITIKYKVFKNLVNNSCIKLLNLAKKKKLYIIY